MPEDESKNKHIIYDVVSGEIADYDSLMDQIAKKGLPKSIMVEADVAHTGFVNVNGYKFNSSYAPKAAKSFTEGPHGKPVLRHHNADEDAIGRVKGSSFVNIKPTGDNTPDGAIRNKMEITDPDAIRKFVDGRYATYSTGSNVRLGNESPDVKCSVCGQLPWRFGGTCDHIRNEIYRVKKDGKNRDIKCYWDINKWDYPEVSTVNIPSDKYSSTRSIIIKDFVNGSEDNSDIYLDRNANIIIDSIDWKDDEKKNNPDIIIDDDSNIEKDNNTKHNNKHQEEDMPGENNWATEATKELFDLTKTTLKDTQDLVKEKDTHIQTLNDQIKSIENEKKGLEDTVKVKDGEITDLKKNLEDAEKTTRNLLTKKYLDLVDQTEIELSEQERNGLKDKTIDSLISMIDLMERMVDKIDKNKDVDDGEGKRNLNDKDEFFVSGNKQPKKTEKKK